jgi:hypothetical protein
MSRKYVSQVPKTVPPGSVLVHNGVRANPRTKPGDRGFRAWFAQPAPHHVRCDCGWALRLGRHFRVNNED